MEYSYKDVKFTKNTMIIHTEEKDIIIKFKEIFGMYYKKLTFVNFIFGRDLDTTFNVLYVIKNDCVKRENIIRIRYPYKILVTIPRQFFECIEFEGEGGIFPGIWN